MRGIYAGKDFAFEEHIEDGPVITVLQKHIKYVPSVYVMRYEMLNVDDPMSLSNVITQALATL